jgi:truncated hemoglobin YjbI
VGRRPVRADADDAPIYERHVPPTQLAAALADLPQGHPEREAQRMADAFGGPRNNSQGSLRFTARLTEEQRAWWVTLGNQAATETGLPSESSFRAALAPYLEWDPRHAPGRASADRDRWLLRRMRERLHLAGGHLPGRATAPWAATCGPCDLCNACQMIGLVNAGCRRLREAAPPDGGVRVSRVQLVVGAPIALAVSRYRFAKLRRVRPRPYALSEAEPHMPRILWSEGFGQGLTEVVLAYGHPHDVSKPLIQVQTCFSEEDCYSPSLEEAIARAEHRDACFARLEWVAGDSFDPFPELPVPDQDLDHNERILAVDGEERSVTVVSHGTYAALRFRQGPVLVTAVARLGFPLAMSFRVIDDLEPYFAGYRRFVLGFMRLLPPARGMRLAGAANRRLRGPSQHDSQARRTAIPVSTSRKAIRSVQASKGPCGD